MNLLSNYFNTKYFLSHNARQLIYKVEATLLIFKFLTCTYYCIMFRLHCVVRGWWTGLTPEEFFSRHQDLPYVPLSSTRHILLLYIFYSLYSACTWVLTPSGSESLKNTNLSIVPPSSQAISQLSKLCFLLTSKANVQILFKVPLWLNLPLEAYLALPIPTFRDQVWLNTRYIYYIPWAILIWYCAKKPPFQLLPLANFIFQPTDFANPVTSLNYSYFPSIPPRWESLHVKVTKSHKLVTCTSPVIHCRPIMSCTYQPKLPAKTNIFQWREIEHFMNVNLNVDLTWKAIYSTPSSVDIHIHIHIHMIAENELQYFCFRWISPSKLRFAVRFAATLHLHSCNVDAMSMRISM